MAQGIQDWSLTAGSNGSADANINFAEGQSPASLNNSARAMMAALAAFYDALGGGASYGGSSNAYTITNSAPGTWSAYAEGQIIGLEANHSNTGAATVNVDTLGAKSIVKGASTALVSGDIISGAFYLLRYDGTNFQLINPVALTLDATLIALGAVSWSSGKALLQFTAADTVSLTLTPEVTSIAVADGSVSAVGVKIGDEQNGFYSPATNQLGMALNGTQYIGWSTTAMVLLNGMIYRGPNGSVSAPLYAFQNDTNNGLYYIGTDNWGLSAGGSKVADVSSAGLKDASGNLWQVGGKHMLPLPAAAWRAQTTNGAASYSAELSTNKQMVQGWAFDKDTDEFIQISIPMPKSWDEGTFTARVRWYAPSGSGNVVWGVQALCVGDDDALDAAWGTAQTVTDALTATGDMMVTAETSAITAAGSPAEADTLWIRVYRDADNGSDTFSADAVLLSVELFPVLSGANDA